MCRTGLVNIYRIVKFCALHVPWDQTRINAIMIWLALIRLKCMYSVWLSQPEKTHMKNIHIIFTSGHKHPNGWSLLPASPPPWAQSWTRSTPPSSHPSCPLGLPPLLFGSLPLPQVADDQGLVEGHLLPPEPLCRPLWVPVGSGLNVFLVLGGLLVAEWLIFVTFYFCDFWTYLRESRWYAQAFLRLSVLG